MSETYFLGSMTGHGFRSAFDDVIGNEDYFTYILKGGAGTGKSSLMKKVAAEFENSEHVIRYRCSSDPDSLDAVVLTESGVVIVDGTAPHVYDPVIPGVCQKIINLGEYWDTEKLKANKDQIIEAIKSNKSMMDRARRFTAAISNVYSDTYQIGRECLLIKKFNAFITRFKKKLLPKGGHGKGETAYRQLSALTRYGHITFNETLNDYFDIYYINDEYYAATDLLLKSIASEATAKGYDIICCASQLFNNQNLEHILIPELGIALIGSNPMTNLIHEKGKAINMHRFYDKKSTAFKKSRLKLNALTCKSLSNEISNTLDNAKLIHDDIEKYYIDAMDFDKVNCAAEEICRQIRGI